MSIQSRQITREDLEALKQDLLKKVALKKELIGLATKEDLKGLARSEDLTGLATKEDLKGLARREELAALATKEELRKLDQKTDRIIGTIMEMQDQMAGFETKADADRKFNLLLNAIDSLSHKFDNLIAENAAFHHAYLRHDKILDEHETRIQRLESIP